MKVKTLLLGSGAVFAAAGGAQAADLSIAEPIDYVRVCDAMGTGFWYIPGTDTCIRIGGEVQFTAHLEPGDSQLYGGYTLHEVVGTDSFTYTSYDGSSSYTYTFGYPFGPGGQVEFDDSNNEYDYDHSSLWAFETEATLEVEAKSMTEYGVLTAFIQMQATSDNAQQPTVTHVCVGPTVDPADEDDFGNENCHDLGGDNVLTVVQEQVDVERIFYVEEAYIELGFLKVGYFDSTFRGPGDYAGGSGLGEFRPGNDTVDQILLSWEMNGFGLSIGIEDPRDRFGTELPEHYDLPNIVGVIEAEVGPFDNRLSAVIGEHHGYWNTQTFTWHPDFYSWGVNATTTIDLSSLGDLRVSAYFGNDSQFVDEIGTNDEDAFNWTIFGSWRYDITPDVRFDLTGTYASCAVTSCDGRWGVFGDLVFDVGMRTTATIGGGWLSSGGDAGWGIAGELETELVPDQFTTSISGEYHEDGDWEAEWSASREF
jgi:hypothetical protein